jgi:hypothetical protein
MMACNSPNSRVKLKRHMTDFHKIAKTKFGAGVPITAQGRFALCSLDTSGQIRSVYLLETADGARSAALGIDRAKIVDLELSPSASCPLPRKCSESVGYE